MADKIQYDDGLELAQYHGTVDDYGVKDIYNNPGMGHDDYGGMAVNDYHGMRSPRPAPSENGSYRKHDSLAGGLIYEEDLRSRLHRELKTRQISMIALGGALGTGLLINTGPYLAVSGPVSLLIGYALVGVLCYAVMAALGEMAAWLPIASGFTGFAHRFVDPALGFALGWNYWFKYIITTPNNIIACTLVIKYWFDASGYSGPASSAVIWVTLLLVAIITINYFSVGVFGEFEFWLSTIKGPPHHPGGFHYWVNPGAFAPYIFDGGIGKFLGFWNVLFSAVFSFLGAELVGVTVGEAQNPRKAVPKAIKLTFLRIVFFYIVLIFLLGLTVPYNSHLLLTANNVSLNTVSAEASPFVVAATLAGVQTVPDIMNICLLIFTFSAANSDLYIATRSLYSLAVEGNAPRIFSRTNDRGVPIYSLGLCSACCLIAYISIHVGSFNTFQYFVSLVTIFGILTWMSILISHIYFVRARKAQGIPDTALAFVSPFGIRGSTAALIFAAVIMFFNGFADFAPNTTTGQSFDWPDFIVNYIGVLIFAVMFCGYKIFMKTHTWTAKQADLTTGKARIDEVENEFLAAQVGKDVGIRQPKLKRVYSLTLGNFF
ncbi:hypothetical protein G7Y89_g4873 [Cudoniella acicularis]|uniref:Amino acid permease/ SLC12A domain-containing protein n=1 Tax=Cudoniella acicularis TaxID=354080 RepID=A0A8H4RNK3_9HELO|nr:hypothetical protein G7Y89_g4873 [Cudoniella acicularis]